MDTRNLGFVVWTSEVNPRQVTKVREAAVKAGFEPEVIRDIKPRNAFIRAAQELVKEGVLETGNKGLLRDKILDESTEIAFQFSKREVHEHAEYLKQAVIRYNKDKQSISVDRGDLSESDYRLLCHKVQELFERKAGLYSGQDFNMFIDRVFSKNTRRIMLRPGVHFVDVKQQPLVLKVRKFFEELGFVFTVLTVGAGDEIAKRDVLTALTQDLCVEAAKLIAEVKELSSSQGLTERIARSRLKEVKQNLQHYRDLASALNTSLEKVLRGAGEAGTLINLLGNGVDYVVQQIQTGQTLDPFAIKLVEQATGKPLTALAVQTGALVLPNQGAKPALAALPG